MTTAKTVLVTGADGYIGSRLAAHLITAGHNVVAWVRADDAHEYDKKRSALLSKLPQTPRAITSGNLCSNDPFEALRTYRTDFSMIVHSAAVTRFNVEEDVADAVNIMGTRKLIQFAGECKNLEQFLLISSVYSTGLRAGSILEIPYDTPAEGFSNHYERSKFRNEQDVMDSNLPWRIARVSTVVSDSVLGEVSQFNAVHNTLKLFYYGMLSIIPGHKDTRLYFVTGDFVTEALSRIIAAGSDSAIYNVCHEAQNSIQLDQFVQHAYSTFMQDENFKKRRVLPPLYSDIDSFLSLSDSMVHFGQGIMSQASASITPFARQLFVHKDVSNAKLRAIMSDYDAPDTEALIRAMSAWLAENKWGRAKVVAV